MKEFYTERLHLRRLLVDDVHDVFEYCSLSNVVNMVGMRLHTSKEVTKKYIEHENSKSETYAIVLRTSNKVIGTVSLRPQYNDSGLDIRLISCVVNPNYWGKGYAPEAIKVLIRFAFTEEKVHKILGGHYSFNKQSESLNRKLGFIYEGTKREVVLYNNQLVDMVDYGMLYVDFEKAFKDK